MGLFQVLTEKLLALEDAYDTILTPSGYIQLLLRIKSLPAALCLTAIFLVYHWRNTNTLAVVYAFSLSGPAQLAVEDYIMSMVSLYILWPDILAPVFHDTLRLVHVLVTGSAHRQGVSQKMPF